MAVTKIFFNMRLKVMMALACMVCAVIALRLIDIQVLRHQTYLQMAERNRTQVIYQTAPRGRVFTADGVAVASNEPSFSFYYLAAGNKDPEYLSRLAHDFAPHLKMTSEEVLEKLEKGVKSGKATVLAENLSTKSTVALQELQLYYPGVYLVEETKRNYPYGGFASHLIGYLGSMDDREWRKRDLKMGYRLNSKLGKNGIEKKFEKELKGRDGGVYLEVDYRGRVKSIIEDKKWAAGSDVYLTLNFDVQKAAEEGLKNSLTGRGAAVALDPRTGAVLALASAPSYDPNIFVPYSDEEFPKKSKKISEYNLAIQGIYPPASTFKVITAAAALEGGHIQVERKINCLGHYDSGPRVFKCWGTHGPVNFFEGMSNSCDVYFYTIASQIGAASIEKIQRKFMFGRQTGIDLPGEKAGNMYGPTRRARNKTYWFVGDTLNLSIGQGELLVTPLKLAQFAAAIASRGNVYKPYYVEKIVSNQTGKEEKLGKTEILQKAELKPETYDLIFEALKYTVDKGTAARVKLKGKDVYGKTGTAQNPHGADHGWFMAFAAEPGQEPSIALAVFVEFGEGGSSAAGPIARKMLEAYFGMNKPKPAAPARTAEDYRELLPEENINAVV
ncbi:MAG: penicillin-binding protein 2 [Elusimicrobium sp.]|uniref:Penicillin-binding protein 2 n=1 Tax=Candidatus Avelusimicrobium gallicola TaxID=2562704 RepID=A0A928DQI5_9BACT|nr:penicillin-binding protein 2 [Elusimicrobium sp.]